MDAIETIEYKDYTIEVYSDDDPMNPRTEWDNLGVMVCWHRRYNMGDEQPRENPDDWFRYHINDLSDDKLESMDLAQLQAHFEKSNLLIPIMMYDHSGVTIKAYNYGRMWDGWDSGQLGFIYVSHDAIKKEYSVKRLTKKTLEKARHCLESEISVYDDYLTGNVYGYKIIEPDGDDGDSCWGFYGDYNDYMVGECKSIIDHDIAAVKETIKSMSTDITLAQFSGI